MHFGRLLLVSAVLPLLALGAPVNDNEDGLVARGKKGPKPPKANPTTKAATQAHPTTTKATGHGTTKANPTTHATTKSSGAHPTSKGHSSSEPTGTKSAHGTKSSSCPLKKKPKTSKPGHGKRAPIPIGYRGVTSDVAEEYEKGTIPESKNVARLGKGLYLTDNYKLAETFAYDAQKKDKTKKLKGKICVAMVDDSAWKELAKVWIPNKDGMIDPNPTNSEPKREAYQKEHCAEGPAVRFSYYNARGAPKGNELVIPKELQTGVTIKCYDLPEATIDSDSEDESPPSGTPALGYKYNTKATEWNIMGEVETK